MNSSVIDTGVRGVYKMPSVSLTVRVEQYLFSAGSMGINKHIPLMQRGHSAIDQFLMQLFLQRNTSPH